MGDTLTIADPYMFVMTRWDRQADRSRCLAEAGRILRR
jgi:hypothetical protein